MGENSEVFRVLLRNEVPVGYQLPFKKADVPWDGSGRTFQKASELSALLQGKTLDRESEGKAEEAL